MERKRGISERMEWENPVLYWRRRSRQALETQGVVLPPKGRPRQRHPICRRPPAYKLPRGVVNVRHRFEHIGVDLICNTCEREISKFERRHILCHFYSPDGPQGSPLTRCFAMCPNCDDEWELGRNIGDADNFVVIAGAIQHFPATEDRVPVADPQPDLQSEAYPDAVLDSPNDYDARPPHVVPLDERRLIDEVVFL